MSPDMPPDVRPVIRVARAADLRHLAEVEEDAATAFADHFGDALTDALRGRGLPGRERVDVPGFLLVATEGEGPPVAFAHVIVVDGCAHLQELAVRRSAARRGLGARLVRAAMEEARWAGHDRLSLCTYADVPFNGPFYRSLGFAEVSRELPFQRDLRSAEAAAGLDEMGRRVVLDVALER